MKLKVLHIVNDLCLGGVSSVLYQLVKEHKKSKYECIILNLSSTGDEKIVKQFEQLKIQIHNAHYFFTDGYSLIDQYKKAYFYKSCFVKNVPTLNIIKEINPTIIHSHVLPFELYVLNSYDVRIWKF